MKYTFILLAFCGLIFSGCSTAYKAAQTPDDVYYSPVKEQKEQYQANTTRDRYQENINSQDDRFLRMKVQNRDRWSTIDDYGYWYDSRYDYNMYNTNYNWYTRNSWYNGFGYNGFGYNGFGYNGFGYTNIFAPNYYGYGGYYSPGYPVVYYKNPKVYTGVTGKSNLATYMNTRYNNQNYNSNKGDANNSNSFGNLMRRVLVPNTNNSNNSSNNSFDRPARTIEPSSTPSSSAGGRSGGYNSTGSSSAPSRPPRN